MAEAEWIKLTLLCLAGAASPGLSWLVIVTMSANHGIRTGLAGALGHGLGIAVFALITVFGLSAVLLAAPELARVMTWLGIGLLAYFGYQLVRAGVPPLPEQLKTGSGFIAGFLVAIVNPKVLVFFLAVFGPFIDPNHSIQTQVSMGVLAGLIDALIYTLVALFALAARRFLHTQRLIHFNRLLGVTLLLSSGWLAVHST
jgi:threonine/homoserine/homoserine lactone efflux protein